MTSRGANRKLNAEDAVGHQWLRWATKASSAVDKKRKQNYKQNQAN